MNKQETLLLKSVVSGILSSTCAITFTWGCGLRDLKFLGAAFLLTLLFHWMNKDILNILGMLNWKKSYPVKITLVLMIISFIGFCISPIHVFSSHIKFTAYVIISVQAALCLWIPLILILKLYVIRHEKKK